MRIIIAGTRKCDDYDKIAALVDQALKETGWKPTEIVSGRASGVDSLGERWAAEHQIPVKPFPADWGFFGAAAGPMRNGQMAAYADALIAFPGPTSRGTLDMIRKMKVVEKPVWSRGL